MNLLITILLLLVCLLISNIISRYTPFIPTALIQIMLGIFLAFIFRDISFELETEWFLLLFVAPLLYNDGRHFPRQELWNMRESILGNAIILVLLTTLGGGYFIHWLIPEIPLAAAFALAAILSPTDPVAVNGIAKRIKIPDNVLTLVRGESLINDASGLVAFNYAVAAVVTGYFSLKQALFDFTYMFIAGAALGLVLGLFITWGRYMLRKKGITDVTFHALFSILTPFIIYIITEELLHASGVIAVVIAGIVHSILSERTETLVAEERVLTENIWSIILFVLNGIVFLLLGLNIPASMAETVDNPNINNLLAVTYVIVFGIVILGIRFIWSYIFNFYKYWIRKKNGAAKPSVKTSLLVSFTGVRGAVTMAGILSIPYLTADGSSFPERSLILFLAAGVILFTLLVATVFLPLFSRNETLKEEHLDQAKLTQAKGKILLAAIQAIRQEMNEENESIAYELIDEYKLRFSNLLPAIQQQSERKDYIEKLTNLRLFGIKEERKYIQALLQNKQISQNVYETFENILDNREEVLSDNVRTGTSYLFGRVLREWKRLIRQYRRKSEDKQSTLQMAKDIQIKAIQQAIEKLTVLEVPEDEKKIVEKVISDYNRTMWRLKKDVAPYDEKLEDLKEILRIKVIDVERYEIQKMVETGEISSEQAKELRRYINYIEGVTLYEYSE
ncbi:hypothetical protein B4064_2186 [Caldibacillus thermoamylovorans]|uniref:Na+/H+ antiporter n=1 Tax=Bacillaceae TaxID=186817 RepID=UPI0005A4A5A1|nr:Na+/H+ antiporter [Caldibacillus thermoamylovorans]KIO66494.1 hypothetical protein B4064_2186 [Caldibacillus thermoamylovorans]